MKTGFKIGLAALMGALRTDFALAATTGLATVLAADLILRAGLALAAPGLATRLTAGLVADLATGAAAEAAVLMTASAAATGAIAALTVFSLAAA